LRVPDRPDPQRTGIQYGHRSLQRHLRPDHLRSLRHHRAGGAHVPAADRRGRPESVLPNVEVKGFSGLVVDFARDNGVTVLVRGVRTVGDVDYEKQMAVMNRDLYPQLDTVMLAPSPQYAHLSSSLVRELAALGAPVEKLVPAAVIPALRARVGLK
jgi:hypothetical protein